MKERQPELNFRTNFRGLDATDQPQQAQNLRLQTFKDSLSQEIEASLDSPDEGLDEDGRHFRIGSIATESASASARPLYSLADISQLS